jgi:hypothetical protein
MVETNTPQQANTTPQYEVRAPDGSAVDPAVVARWTAVFKEGNLTQAQADRVVDWHYRLRQEAEQHQVEQSVMAPHERAALSKRQGELQAKRFTRAGLTAGEFQELMRANERFAVERERDQT